jgi:hypothetical protein
MIATLQGNRNHNALPEWIEPKLIEDTIAVWNPFYGRSLTPAEAIEILQSVGRLVDVLQEPET